MNNENTRKALQEAVNSMFRIQGEKDHLTAIADRMKEEEGFEKSKWNKMVKYAYNNEIDTDLAKLEEIQNQLAELGVE